jgi:drug/metabolite transporter (DMT)-like permease
MVALGLGGLLIWGGGIIWLSKNFNDWTVLAIFAGIYGLICAAALFYQRVRRHRRAVASQPQSPPTVSA